MFTIETSTIIKVGIGFLCSVIVTLLTIIGFFIKRFMEDVRDANTDTKQHFKETDEKLTEISKKAEERFDGLSSRLDKIETICQERRCIDGKN